MKSKKLNMLLASAVSIGAISTVSYLVYSLTSCTNTAASEATPTDAADITTIWNNNVSNLTEKLNLISDVADAEPNGTVCQEVGNIFKSAFQSNGLSLEVTSVNIILTKANTVNAGLNITFDKPIICNATNVTVLKNTLIWDSKIQISIPVDTPPA